MVQYASDFMVASDEWREESKAQLFDDVTEETGETASEREFHDAALRVVVQRNDFLLPNLIDMIKSRRTVEVSPYYQRRARWDVPRKSKLIESFLVNIPVPPVFLYENEFASYEVMDGQQRVSAILEYFNNQFALRGLEILHSLAGKRFHQLPFEIKAGLERRSLAAIILLKESTNSPESTAQLRRFVFERLNTGGVRLNAQEVRNSVHAGPFNDLLLELSRHQLFTTMWDIPPREPNESTEPSPKLARNVLFRQMRDAELVLRVFALLDPGNLGTGMKGTLDSTMTKYAKASQSDLLRLEQGFLQALELAHAMGGNDAFRLPGSGSKRGRLSASLFDGLMVALIRKLDDAARIKESADQIQLSIRQGLTKQELRALVVGRANTREATIKRSQYFEKLIESAIVFL